MRSYFTVCSLLVALSCACGAAVRAKDPVDAGIASFRAHASLQELTGLTPEQRFDLVYDTLFGAGALDREAPGIDEPALRAALARAGGGEQEGPWFVVDGRGGEFQKPVRRVYLTLRVRAAADAVRAIPTACRRRGIRFWFKILQQLDQYPRTSSAVLFVEQPDAAVAIELLRRFAREHPDALRADHMPFALAVAPGISSADQPSEPWPALGAPHSFGSFMAAVFLEAVEPLPANATDDAVARRVRDTLRRYGVDPARPWVIDQSRVARPRP